MSAELDQLTTDIGALTTVVADVATRIKPGVDPAKLVPLSAAVQAATKALTDAFPPPPPAAP